MSGITPATSYVVDNKQLTANSINADDSIAECKNLLDKRIYYISGTGGFYYDPTVETHEYVFRALSLGITNK